MRQGAVGDEHLSVSLSLLGPLGNPRPACKCMHVRHVMVSIKLIIRCKATLVGTCRAAILVAIDSRRERK